MTSRSARLVEVARAFLLLGCTSFGGPIAHVGYVRNEIVVKRRWLDEAEYADLVALCQLLPGPSSSQVVFALGLRRAGLAGAMVASACFTASSAALMIGLAYGLARLSDAQHAGWLHGLHVAAVAVVAQAVCAMAGSLCPDGPRRAVAVAAAVASFLLHGAFVQVAVIAAGAIAGRWAVRVPLVAGEARSPGSTRGAVAALALALGLFVALPLAARATGAHDLRVVDAFYRSGALVFGGGHVVLPLLRAEIVPPGWLGDDVFLAGYGAAQALPGPLFAFAAYLGAAMRPGAFAWAHGLVALVALFLPGWLLVLAASPFWARLRARAAAAGAFAGAGAAVVGLLAAALWSPVGAQGIRGGRDAVLALLAFGALQLTKAPPWAVVLGTAALTYVLS